MTETGATNERQKDRKKEDKVSLLAKKRNFGSMTFGRNRQTLKDN